LLHVRLVTSDGIAYDGPSTAVTAPGVGGNVTVLLHHAPMLSMLEPGELVIQSTDGNIVFAIGGGCLDVIDDVVTIIAESAERPEEIDLAQAEADVQQAEKLAKRYRSRPEATQAALQRAKVRLRVARRAQRPGGT